MSDDKNPSAFPLTILFLALGTLGVVALAIVGASRFFDTEFRTEKDFMNWSAVIMEAGIAGFMSVVVLLYDGKRRKKSDEEQKKMNDLLEKSKKQQDETADLIMKIEKMELRQQEYIVKQEKFIENRKNFAYIKILHELANILEWINAIETSIPEEGEPYTHGDEMFETYIDYLNHPKSLAIPNIKSVIELSNDVIEPRVLDDILSFIDLAEKNSIVIVDGRINRKNIGKLKNPINTIVSKIPMA